MSAVRGGTLSVACLAIAVAAGGCSFLGSSPEREIGSAIAALDATADLHIEADLLVEEDGDSSEWSMAGDATAAHETDMLFARGLDTVQEITIGEDRYVKYSELGRWARGTLTPDDLGPASMSWPLRYVEYLKSPASVRYLGTAMIDGLECYRYRIAVDESRVVDGIIAAMDEAGVTLDEDARFRLRRLYRKSEISLDVWISTLDHLPRREYVDVTVTARQRTRITGTVDFTQFDDAPRIESPQDYTTLDEAEYALRGEAPESYTSCSYTQDWLEAEVDWHETLHGTPPVSLEQVAAMGRLEVPTCISLGVYSLVPETGDVVCSVHGHYPPAP